MRVSLILILLFSFGCARHLRIYSKGCDMPAVWLNIPKDERDFEFEYKIYGSTFGFDATKVNVVEVLSNKNYVCEEIDALSIQTHQSGLDVLAGLIPFLSRTTLIVSGRFKGKRVEAIEVDEFQNERKDFAREFKKLQKKLRSQQEE